MSIKLKENLKTVLRERGKTASWLAKQSGVPRTTISSWLKGQAAVNVEQLTRVSGTLKISLWRLLHNLNEPDPNEVSLSPDTLITKIFEGDLRVQISKIERKKI